MSVRAPGSVDPTADGDVVRVPGHSVWSERQDGVGPDLPEQPQDSRHADLCLDGRTVAVMKPELVVLADADGGKAAAEFA
jgi:hypothetical protein